MSDVLRTVPSTSIWDQHRAILDAIVAGDADAAAARAGRHVIDAAERLARAHEDQGARA
jgi:DNA-binding FadR family transcriptional regulator